MSGVRLARRALLGSLLMIPAVARADDRQRFDAVLHDGDHARVVGEVSLDRFGRVALLSAAPDRSDWLRRVTSEANAAQEMHADVAPRAGSPPFTDASRIVKRGDPDFPRALKDYLRAYYGLELRAR